MHPARICNAVLALVLCGTLSAGCGSGESGTEKVAEKMIESAAKIKGDEMDEVLHGYKPTKKEDTEAEEAAPAEETAPVEKPEDFPEDVPLMPGFRLTAAEAAGEAPGSYTLAGTLPADSRVALTYYSRNLGARGWEEQADDAPDARVLTFSKDGRTVVVAATPGEAGGTALTVTHLGD